MYKRQAFNKSHATCYSWVAFQTAYLKANYPAEYMAAVLTRNLSDLTKLTGFMDECKRMHISVKGPDVNESYAGFGVNSHGDIRFGLAAVKGVGEGVVADIIRGVEINKALGILRYSKKEASIRMEKLLKSAIANWEAKNESERLEDVKLCVKEVFLSLIHI